MTLRREGYMERLIETRIRDLLKEVDAISIEGPKCCGKTWCAESLASSEYSLVDPAGNFQKRRAAGIDPSIALDGDEPHLIDEWQDVPEIWDAVRYSLDQSRVNGRFILCGSSTVDKGRISHSGAGRIVSVRMRTMSLFESGDSSGKVSLDSLFQGRLETCMSDPMGLDRIAYLIVRGGWPDLIGKSEDTAYNVLSDYLYKVCETDAQKIDGKRRDVGKLIRTIRSLARNESTVISVSKIASDIREFEHDSIVEETVAEYLGVLDGLFILDNQPAYSPNYRSSMRVGKSPKRHFVDPSLAAAALGLDAKALTSDPRTMGFLFEALCERDLRIYADGIGGTLYHYRDYGNKEIDAIVDVPGRGWGAFEIKLGEDSVDSAAESLLRIDRMMESDGEVRRPAFLCVICGTGGIAYRREDGVFVVPIHMLGP